MKVLQTFEFDFDRCTEELSHFKSLLENNETLDEQQAILPFFKESQHLSAFIGHLTGDLSCSDRYAFEFPLGGDFVCDLVVGDWDRGCYCFVEFEDASPASVFRQAGARTTPEWSPRFEHGFSQIIDWFQKLRDMSSTGDFQIQFGRRDISYCGMLIVGRSSGLGEREIGRLRWRKDNVVVDSKQIVCLTFDQLHETLATKAKLYQPVWLAETQS